MSMPDQIAAWKDATERFGSWCVAPENFPAEGGETLYVLATTHARTVEALREALQEQLVDAYNRRDNASGVHTMQFHAGRASGLELAIEYIDAALAKIKEAADGR